MSEPSAIRAVLFDIDGTLLVTGGAGGVAWQRAFEELHGVEADIAEHTDAGMTDPEIAAIVFREVIGREGSPEERSKAIGCYLKHLPDAVAESAGYRVMPGIEGLLPRLIEDGILLGLVTGNIEAAAHIKLARARLNRFFSFGGYGSDSADRTAVTEAALGRGALVSGGTLADGNCIAVGDTPRDVKAGHGAGIAVAGVATGSYSVTALSEAGADWALETVERGFPLQPQSAV
ncbi:MAG TPA: HAD hydrolase-like protein [Solirubrobacterales bacterium]|nr:HAD hydrolase-like protein [Solirubrobacterales bacterium]